MRWEQPLMPITSTVLSDMIILSPFSPPRLTNKRTPTFVFIWERIAGANECRTTCTTTTHSWFFTVGCAETEALAQEIPFELQIINLTVCEQVLKAHNGTSGTHRCAYVVTWTSTLAGLRCEMCFVWRVRIISIKCATTAAPSTNPPTFRPFTLQSEDLNRQHWTQKLVALLLMDRVNVRAQCHRMPFARVQETSEIAILRVY